MAILEIASNPETVRAYRVEGTANTHILINDAGEVIIDMKGQKVLYLNFGDRVRAKRYLAMKVRDSLPEPVLKSFEVPRSYYEYIRDNAVPQRLAKRAGNRNKPYQVDETQTSDSYALRQEQIQVLQAVIIQGSGMVEYP